MTVNCPHCGQTWPHGPTKCAKCGVEDDSPEIEPFGMFWIPADPPTITATLPTTEDKPAKTVTLPRKVLVCQECWWDHRGI